MSQTLDQLLDAHFAVVDYTIGREWAVMQARLVAQAWAEQEVAALQRELKELEGQLEVAEQCAKPPGPFQRCGGCIPCQRQNLRAAKRIARMMPDGA